MSSQSTTTDVAALIDRYIAVWNETDPAARRALIDVTWAENATYRDPALEGSGRDGIDAMTAGFQRAYPGHTFERSDEPQISRHEQRFGWRLLTLTGEVFLTGEDVYELSADGLLQSIVGTVDQP
ncbi:MAG: nuclear transport factor 2 family protein [Chloroflexia bacterium]|nr:nuclear transport factor 2 family protein [Chloroflexia bacterium]